jgi:protein-export membrane protein SecD
VVLAACDKIALPSSVREDGPYLIVEIDLDALYERALDELSVMMGETLRAATPSIRYSGRGVVGDAARIRLVDAADMPRAREALANHSNAHFTTGDDGTTIEARPDRAALQATIDAEIPITMEVLRRRLQAVGATVAPFGTQRIIIRTPGNAVPGAVRAMVSQEGRLTFHLVREIPPTDLDVERLPPGTMLAPPYPGSGHAEVVERRPRLTGESLTRVLPSTDQNTGGWVISFQFDEAGSRSFCQLTRHYVGQRFAILLDGQVLTAPTINEEICGGSGQISGNFTAQAANELSIMLNAGGLPVPLTVVAEGVGPTPG